jgi:hypothetical protein
LTPDARLKRGRMKSAYLVIFFLSLLSPASVTAEDATAPADKPGIVVTAKGESLDPQVVARQARVVTRETDLLDEPLPRFDEFACPGVIGLSKE